PQARQQKRLRWYLEREPAAASAVLHILLRVVEAHLRKSCPGTSVQARFGAVSFVHRFGAALNRHLHYHCCILDGVFEPLGAGGVQFRQASSLTPEEIAVLCEQVRRHVLQFLRVCHRYYLHPIPPGGVEERDGWSPRLPRPKGGLQPSRFRAEDRS
ncbi:MAG: transposase, partial [Jiangellales bacterium]